MKTTLFCLLGIVCLAFTSCNENKVVEEDPADHNLGATVQTILKEEQVNEAIWNPHNLNAQDYPVVEVQNEAHLRQLIKDMSLNAQKMNKTIDHINQVNNNRYQAFREELAGVQSRRDSLRIAMDYPDIVFLRDTLELIDLGLVSRK